MRLQYSKKEITQILLLAVIFTVLFRVVNIYANWSLPLISTVPPPPAFPYTDSGTGIILDNVINTGSSQQIKAGDLVLDAEKSPQNNPLVGTNPAPASNPSTTYFCADADGYIKRCEDADGPIGSGNPYTP